MTKRKNSELESPYPKRIFLKLVRETFPNFRLWFHSLRIMSNKIFGEKGIDLVKEASRSNFNLTPFNEDVVRQVPNVYKLKAPIEDF